LHRPNQTIEDDGGDQPDERAEDTGQETGESTAGDGKRATTVLRVEIGGEKSAADDPETTAVSDADERQRRQYTDEQAAEDDGISRSTRAPDG
jgi:hypothetical protein